MPKGILVVTAGLVTKVVDTPAFAAKQSTEALASIRSFLAGSTAPKLIQDSATISKTVWQFLTEKRTPPEPSLLLLELAPGNQSQRNGIKLSSCFLSPA
jgi:hypothetical protein